MPMKLLNPFANKDKQQEEITRKLLRSQEVNDMATKANANLARAEAEFHSTMALNSQKWALEEQEHAQRIRDMSQEIEALEERKKQALIPIYVYKEEADKLMADAKDIFAMAKEKDEQNDFLQDKLEEKLLDVADRENMVLKEEKRQKNALLGIESQREQTKKGVDILSNEMILFHEKQKKEESDLLVRKNQVALAEISFNAKVEKYARDLEALKIWDIQLRDERATLDREYARKK